MEKLNSLLIEMKQCLIESIPATLSSLEVEEAVYCLGLVYDEENVTALMPPTLALGLESERKAKIEKGGKYLVEFLWSPYEFSLYVEDNGIEIDDDRLYELCDQINEELNQIEDGKQLESVCEVVFDVVLEASIALGTLNWGEILNVTSDFIVYATDAEGARALDNIRKIVDPNILQQFEENGLI